MESHPVVYTWGTVDVPAISEFWTGEGCYRRDLKFSFVPLALVVLGAPGARARSPDTLPSLP